MFSLGGKNVDCLSESCYHWLDMVSHKSINNEEFHKILPQTKGTHLT